MTTDDIRTEAEALRLQMMIGLGQPADVIAWADRMIETEETPHIAIIELALAGDESLPRLASRLNDIPGKARMSEAIRMVLRGLLDALDRGRNPETVARRLYTLAQAVNWPEEEFGTEPHWLDERFHPEMGVPFQEAVAELREYLTLHTRR